MTTVSLVSNKQNNIDLVIEPAKSAELITIADIDKLIDQEGYQDLARLDDNIKNALAELSEQLKTLTGDQQGKKIVYQILERLPAKLSVTIDKDEMTAIADITTAQGGKHLTAQEILDGAKALGVRKGFRKQALIDLTKQAHNSPAGVSVNAEIAFGKLPEKGKDTRIKPLVESAQNRILKPQEREDGTVDMRDLGAIICVKVGDPLVERIPFTMGVQGYTVTGTVLHPEPGEDKELVPGEGTELDPKNNNLLLSTLVGLPKITNNGMEVDQVFITKNVDVGSGHIDFEGSVIVEGDVKENMRVSASGDITVGGFVESAELKAGGDITIAKGIIGKKQDVETTSVEDIHMSACLKAGGNIFAMYSQYAQIECQGNMRIENQLMHNIIHLNGSLWVGEEEKLDGKLIAGYISTNESVYAGTIGATAGSATIIVFKDKLALLRAELEIINEKFHIESSQVEELQGAVKKLKALPKDKAKPELLTKIVTAYKQHAKLMGELLLQKQAQEASIQDYLNNTFVEAREKLFQGVEVHLGELCERSKREYGPSRMRYQDRKIIVDPIVND